MPVPSTVVSVLTVSSIHLSDWDFHNPFSLLKSPNLPPAPAPTTAIDMLTVCLARAGLALFCPLLCSHLLRPLASPSHVNVKLNVCYHTDHVETGARAQSRSLISATTQCLLYLGKHCENITLGPQRREICNLENKQGRCRPEIHGNTKPPSSTLALLFEKFRNPIRTFIQIMNDNMPRHRV